MTKQTFTIPEGCKVVTVEQIGNQIITTFEPVFKKERWRAEIEYRYWFVINGCLGVSSTVDARANIDNELYDSGNYFQTEAQAKRAADRLKAELDKFWEEELI